MTTATRENPNLWAHAHEPSKWCGRSKHILLTRTGARKQVNSSSHGEIFLLTSPFIEQRLRGRGAQQRRSSGGERPAAMEEETDRDSRSKQELQSPSEEFVQGCRG